LLLNLRCSASVDRSFAEATRLGEGCLRVGLTDGSGSKGSSKLVIVSLHVEVEVRESALMLIKVRACFLLQKEIVNILKQITRLMPSTQ
jgi:hypothetical protein